MKTKLGISVGMLGAAVYFVSLFNGYIPLVILVGYILLFESNEWLKKNAVKAFAISVVISATLVIIGFIPNFISLIDNVFNLFGGHFSLEFMYKLEKLINIIIVIFEKILFLVLGFKSLNQGSIKIKMIDNLVEKHMN